MAVGTECPLDFRRTLGRKHGAAVFCLHKSPELCSGKRCPDFKFFFFSVSGHTAVEVLRMVGKSDAEFAITPFSGVFSLKLEDGQKKRMIFVFLFFCHNLEPPQKQLPGPGGYFRRIQVGREFQLIQQLSVIPGESYLLPENTRPVSEGERGEKIKVFCYDPLVLLYVGGSIRLSQLAEHWALCSFPLENTVLQPKPHQAFINIAFLILLKAAQHLFQHRIIIVFPHGADDAVPVEISDSVAVVCLEIGAERVVPGAAPDNVFCALLLKLCDFRNHVVPMPYF